MFAGGLFLHGFHFHRARDAGRGKARRGRLDGEHRRFNIRGDRDERQLRDETFENAIPAALDRRRLMPQEAHRRPADQTGLQRVPGFIDAIAHAPGIGHERQRGRKRDPLRRRRIEDHRADGLRLIVVEQERERVRETDAERFEDIAVLIERGRRRDPGDHAALGIDRFDLENAIGAIHAAQTYCPEWAPGLFK